MRYKDILRETWNEVTNSKSTSVLIGDNHSEEFWIYNHNKLRALKPDFLLLEVIGKHRYITKRERDNAKLSYVYMNNKQHQGYNSDAFMLADDLDVPMIGIDVWDKPYNFPKEWEDKDIKTNFLYSHTIRERNMLKVVKEIEDKGKFLLIVGAEHLRDDSILAIHARKKQYSIKMFTL